MLEVAEEEEGEWEREGVSEVVGCGADAGVEEVAEHEEVGSKEEDGEEEPARVEELVGVEGGEEEGGFFKFQEEGGAGEHGLFIRGLAGDGSIALVAMMGRWQR